MSDRHKELHEENSAIRARLAEVERERDEAREQLGLQLAACDCAAIMDTAETHAQNKTVTRDNPSWSPAFESVMRRTAECIQLRADNARLREALVPLLRHRPDGDIGWRGQFKAKCGWILVKDILRIEDALAQKEDKP